MKIREMRSSCLLFSQRRKAGKRLYVQALYSHTQDLTHPKIEVDKQFFFRSDTPE